LSVFDRYHRCRSALSLYPSLSAQIRGRPKTKAASASQPAEHSTEQPPVPPP
jgi:hypothetical protein